MRTPTSTNTSIMMAFFLVVQVLIFLEFLSSTKSPSDFFWYCNHISLLYLYAVYMRRIQMVFGLMFVGIIIQLLWLGDFGTHLLGFHILNTTDYMFVGAYDYIKVITVVIHVCIPVAVLYWVGDIRPRVQSLWYALGYILPVYALTRMYTAPEENINCVYSPCVTFVPSSGYTILWPLYAFLLAACTFFLFDVGVKILSRMKRLWIRKGLAESPK